LRPLYKVVLRKGSTTDRYERSTDPNKGTLEGEAQNYSMNTIRQKVKVFSGKNEMGSGANSESYYRENNSDESILGPEYKANGIKATSEIVVSYSNETAADGHSV